MVMVMVFVGAKRAEKIEPTFILWVAWCATIIVIVQESLSVLLYAQWQDIRAVTHPIIAFNTGSNMGERGCHF